MELTQDTLREMFERLAPDADPDDPKEARRQRILASARELFTERGYRKTSIDDVANHAHVAKGTVYANFENKSALLFAVVAYEKKRFMKQSLEMLDPDISGPERLKRYIKLAMAMPRESPLLAKLLSGDREIVTMLSEMSPGMVSEMQGMQMQFLTKLLDEGLGAHGLSPDELKERAQVLYSLVVKVAQAAADPFGLGFSTQRFTDLVMDVIHRGLDGWGKGKNE